MLGGRDRCVRRMHCNGKTQPHYPCRSSTAFSEKLAADGVEKEQERRMLKGSDNEWLMHDEDFRRHRDVFRERAKREAAEKKEEAELEFELNRKQQ